MRHATAVLVIAGTDSSGGAGLTRDVRVLAECGMRAVPVVTAVTAQSNTRVHAVHALPPEMIRAQLVAALETHAIGAVKIGMLANRATVEIVAECLPSRDDVPIVLDPVLHASSGNSLLDTGGRAALREHLLPKVSIVTPNIPEAALLTGGTVANDEDAAIDQAGCILRMGAQAVLIKGGHTTGPECTDILVAETGAPLRLVLDRTDATLRGTGCALATAIAAGLARKLPLPYACRFAKNYVAAELVAAARGGTDEWIASLAGCLIPSTRIPQ
jgi:hydroxymethylpyrimidine/phosphomethylpyrimidine kinase